MNKVGHKMALWLHVVKPSSLSKSWYLETDTQPAEQHTVLNVEFKSLVKQDNSLYLNGTKIDQVAGLTVKPNEYGTLIAQVEVSDLLLDGECFKNIISKRD